MIGLDKYFVLRDKYKFLVKDFSKLEINTLKIGFTKLDETQKMIKYCF